MNRRLLAPALGFSLIFSSLAIAGTEIKESKQVVVETPFDKGKCEFQLGVGAFTSIESSSERRPDFTDVDGTLRWGTMLNDPSGEGFFRGNFEFMVEAYGAGIVEGPGSYYAGAALMIRYNFIQPDSNWVPYFQIKAGGVYNDVYQDQTQRVFGNDFEFDLGAGLGLRYLFNDHFALFIEGDFRHISNANTADRNYGLNALGGFAGVSYLY